MLKEDMTFSDRLDQDGIAMGDVMEITPVMGKKSHVTIKRTEFHFLSKHYRENQMQGCFKEFHHMKGEKFHVRLRETKTVGRQNATKKRFVLEVIEGNAFKINGNYSFKSYVENGDRVTLGFNRILFKRTAQDSLKLNADYFLDENEAVIRSSLPILFYGETGVGKSTMAKKVHEASGRPGDFVQVNISAFSKNLLESELFGHIKGAFTGAINDKKGFFQKANYGTLFLDEIDSLPLEVQLKLLLFFDNQEVTPVGSNVSRKLDVRIIIASGKKLIPLVEKGDFRRDFYFRLTSGLVHTLRPLRENPTHLKNFCEQYLAERQSFLSSDLAQFYQTLPWPGNYRQLKGHLDLKLIHSRGEKLDFDLVDQKLIEKSSELVHMEDEVKQLTLKQLKIAYAKKVYYDFDRNLSKAAAQLDISTKCLKGLVAH